MVKLFAQSYNTGTQGFYFDTFEEFEEKAAQCFDDCGNVVEEFVINTIDADEDFARVVKINQSNLEEWIEQEERFCDLSGDEQDAFVWLVEDLHEDADTAFDRVDEVSIFNGEAEDYAREFVNDCYDLEEKMGNLAQYFDYAAFANDMQCSGDIVEIKPRVWVTNANDF